MDRFLSGLSLGSLQHLLKVFFRMKSPNFLQHDKSLDISPKRIFYMNDTVDLIYFRFHSVAINDVPE